MKSLFTSSVRPDEANRRYILPGLDGLRAIAVLLVMVYHFWPTVLPGGMIGVDIFFVISGFLITSLLLREGALTGKIALGNFWIRRARRLLPAITLLILVMGPVSLLIGGDIQVNLGRQLAGAATFSSNWISIFAGNDYFAQTSPELFTTSGPWQWKNSSTWCGRCSLLAPACCCAVRGVASAWLWCWALLRH